MQDEMGKKRKREGRGGEKIGGGEEDRENKSGE